MSIAAVHLNQVSIAILNRTTSAYGGLTIGASTPSDLRQQFATRPDVAQAANGLLDRANDNAAPASRNKLLNSIGQSLGDLRSSLDRVRTDTAAKQSAPVPKYTNIQRYAEQDITEQQTVYRLQDVFQDQDRFETRTVYQTRDVFETQNVYATRNVYQTQNVYETRPVYTQQPVYATNVDGTRDLSSYSALSTAGIDIGADFAVTVGSGPTSTIKFKSATRISVTTNGVTTNFSFSANDGSFKTKLVQAFNSVSGLSASIGGDGKLHLTTANAQSLTIADVANQFLDLSGSPLAPLGLTAGTTQSHVSGYQSVQTGTEQVLVGTQQVVVGTEQYVSGTQQVKVGTEQVAVGTEQVKVGTDHVKIGTVQVADGVRTVKIGTKRVEAGTDKVLVGFDTPAPVAPGSAISIAVSNDISRNAKQAVDAIGSPKFGAVKDAVAQLPATPGSNDAVRLLASLIESALTDVSSQASLATTIGKIDDALKAVDQLKSSTTAPAASPSLNPAVLLPVAALGTLNAGQDTASLLIQAVSGYAQSYGSGTPSAIGAGPIRVASLV